MVVSREGLVYFVRRPKAQEPWEMADVENHSLFSSKATFFNFLCSVQSSAKSETKERPFSTAFFGLFWRWDFEKRAEAAAAQIAIIKWGVKFCREICCGCTSFSESEFQFCSNVELDCFHGSLTPSPAFKAQGWNFKEFASLSWDLAWNFLQFLRWSSRGFEKSAISADQLGL